MTQLIDTHTHLYLPEFCGEDPAGGSSAVRRAINAGVGHLIFPNVDLSTIAPMQALAREFPGRISCANGLHPTEVNASWRDVLQQILDAEDTALPVVAIGEVGIDLYWDKTFREEQMQAFSRQCRIAVERRLPLIIHCREGLDEVLEVLSDFPRLPAVFHSFGGTHEDVRRIRRLGDYYFGINGIVTFKNSRLREVLPEIGLDRILLETDSPYLAPVPFRGKRNESAYLPHICAHIAQSMEVTPEAVAAATTAGAARLFNLALAE